MSKYQRILLAIENGVKFILVIPSSSNSDRYPLYWIEYFTKIKALETLAYERLYLVPLEGSGRLYRLI